MILDNNNFLYLQITVQNYKRSVGAFNSNKTNKDIFLVLPNVCNNYILNFFTVCDGYCKNGHLVSGYIRDQLASII